MHTITNVSYMSYSLIFKDTVQKTFLTEPCPTFRTSRSAEEVFNGYTNLPINLVDIHNAGSLKEFFATVEKRGKSFLSCQTCELPPSFR